LSSTNSKVDDEFKGDTSSDNKYKIYTSADQIRRSHDLRYAGINSDLYLSPVEIANLSAKAEKGDGKAAYRLFKYYDYVLHDYDKGFLWLKKSGELGYVQAQHTLGFTYLTISKLRDKKLAYYWFKKGAEQGDAPSIKYLNMFLSDDDIIRLTQLANNGDADAAYKLSEYYSAIELDYNLADYWSKRAAEYGNPDAK